MVASTPKPQFRMEHLHCGFYEFEEFIEVEVPPRQHNRVIRDLSLSLSGGSFKVNDLFAVYVFFFSILVCLLLLVEAEEQWLCVGNADTKPQNIKIKLW